MGWLPENIRAMLITGFHSIQNMEFTFLNPVFWLLMLLIWLLLLRIWNIRKAFSFTAILSVIMLVNTALEKYFGAMMTQPDEVFDPWIIRFVAGIVVAILFITYLFIVDQSG
jgi:hypothetical protein